MTAKELLEELNDCYGPCNKLCLSCPESRYLPEIKQVIEDLIEELDKYKKAYDLATDLDGFYEILDRNGLEF